MTARPWVAGVSLALAASPLTRALVLAVERATRPEPDPTSVVWSEHSAFLDRTLVAAYLTLAAAVALTALARRVRALRGERGLDVALALGAAGALAGLWA